MNGCSFPDTVSSDKVPVVLLLEAEPCPQSLPLVPVMSFHLSGFCPLACCYKIQQLRCGCRWELPAGFLSACFRPCSPRLRFSLFIQHLGCCGKVLLLGREHEDFFASTYLPKNDQPVSVCLNEYDSRSCSS